MACTPGSAPVAPFDTLSSTPAFTWTTPGVDFVLGGAGTRDFDTNTTPAVITLTLPAGAMIVQATLYANLLVEHPFAFPSLDFDVNGGEYTSKATSLIGWCNDTCWLANGNGTGDDGATTPQDIYNRVYTADVIAEVSAGLIAGLNTYSIKLPSVITATGPDSIAVNGSDSAHYPTCTGSNGVALLIVFTDGTSADRRVKIFQGAKLIAPPGSIFGGSSTHTLTFDADEYVGSPVIGLAAGDAQTEYADAFCFNGFCLPPNIYGSAINPNGEGPTGPNLMNTTIAENACALYEDNKAVMTVAGGTECLCWFLFVYCGENATCDEVSLDAGSLSQFKDLTGNYDYVVNGIGTRDLDIANVPAGFVTGVPGAPIEAYLYWNVITDDNVVTDTIILNGTSYTVDGVDTVAFDPVGNTCWSSPNYCGVSDTNFNPGMKNKVYRADVTAQVQGDIPTGGLFTASVTIPNIVLEPLIAFLASDTPHFPGCSGSQSVVLLVIYDSPCGLKHLQVYDGAVLLVPEAGADVYGGTDTYAVDVGPIDEEQTGCSRIVLGISDAQTFFADEFSWNGNPLPQNPAGSYANPYFGNLLHLNEHLVQMDAGSNIIEGSTTDDCLCWFLYVGVTYPLICEPSDCGPNECHTAAPEDQLYRYQRLVGDIDFVLAGVGIRDLATNIVPAVINVTVPGPVIKAYLYWNTIGGADYCPNAAVFDGNPLVGDIIGCCGNTCWAAYCSDDGSDHGDLEDNNNLLNKVWFYDVTSLVPGTGSYSISLPNVSLSSAIAYAASDSPHYPGCCGGQGVALLVIYETEPQVVTRPHQHCCVPVGSETVTERETREIIIWHGAKLLICDGCQPATVDGSNTYSVSWNTKYTWKPKIATAVGDAQSLYADSLTFNGTPLPPFPSYFNPYAGNLLHVKTEYLPAHSAICDCPNNQSNTVTAFTPDDCLCWFLFVWSGAIKCVTPIISSSQSFLSPPTAPMTLWNPNPPDCCPVRLPCCGDICLPARLNVGITALGLECSCLATQGYTMNWDKTQQKYILEDTTGICGCTLFGWLYCVGTQWTLYLALSSGETICSDGMNANFPINCSPFGGVGLLLLNPVNLCDCSCVTDALTITISTG